jgi:hypothetical protein
MDAKDQRIAELEAEVQRLRGLLETSEIKVRHKVRVPGHRFHSVEEVVRHAERRHQAEFVSGLRLLGRGVVAAGLILAGVYLVDYLSQPRWPVGGPPPVTQDALN